MDSNTNQNNVTNYNYNQENNNASGYGTANTQQYNSTQYMQNQNYYNQQAYAQNLYSQGQYTQNGYNVYQQVNQTSGNTGFKDKLDTKLDIFKILIIVGGLFMILAPFLHFRNVKFEVRDGREKYDQEDMIEELEYELDDFVDIDDYNLDKISLVNMPGNINQMINDIEDNTGYEFKSALGINIIPWIFIVMGLIAICSAFIKDKGIKFIPVIGAYIGFVLVDSVFSLVNNNIDKFISIIKMMEDDIKMEAKFSAGIGYIMIIIAMIIILIGALGELIKSKYAKVK